MFVLHVAVTSSALGLPYDERVDTYGFGVILWELVTRSAFFGEIAFAGEVQDRVLAGERPLIPATCPPGYATCIESCWVRSHDNPIGQLSNLIVPFDTASRARQSPRSGGYCCRVGWAPRQRPLHI